MKPYLKLVVPAAMLLTIVYSSCQKAEKAPASNANQTSATAVNDVAASQIAVNLASSLDGAYGGSNANDGVDSVSFDDNHDGPHHGKPGNPLCGFFVDSAVNYNTVSGDTLKSHTGGNLTFYFNCKDGRPDGYKAYDSLNTVGTTPKYAFQNLVKQAYTIRCLDDGHTLNGVNGDIYAYVALNFSDSSLKPYIASGNYVLTNLVIDLRDHDIESGTATFQAYGSNNYGNWTLSGTMTFLGHHQAQLVMNNKTYIINLITGQLTSH
ncbi:MAG TPA: hypothetical protein VFE53_19365 [Mucilaginibacter sp.]|jgi:hypothetical protein|nr:hypothetical protein [Mucilaginibacter sp.]